MSAPAEPQRTVHNKSDDYRLLDVRSSPWGDGRSLVSVRWLNRSEGGGAYWLHEATNSGDHTLDSFCLGRGTAAAVLEAIDEMEPDA